jgi:hypothetical protein
MKLAAALARGCAALCAAAPAAALDFGALDAYASHNAFIEGKPAPVLRLLVGEDLAFAAGSSRPLATIARLYDGDPGALDDVASTFVEFDGARAALDYRVKEWRKPRQFVLTALEKPGDPARLRLVHVDARGRSTPVETTRRVVQRRGEAALVEHAGRAGAGLAAGTIRIEYQAPGSAHARLGEFVVDGMGRGRPAIGKGGVRTVEEWMRLRGESQCPLVRERMRKLGPDPSSRSTLRALLQPVNPRFPTLLVYWKSVPSPDRQSTTHAFVLKVDDTGNVLIDYVRAWLVVPATAARELPLVILPQQGHIYAAQEPLGVQGEVELGMAPDLAAAGIASLAYDAAPFGTPRAAFVSDYLSYYPDSGSTAKDLDNLGRLLDLVMAPAFQSLARVKLDRARVGIWGFSYGAWISMLAGAMDDRIRAIGFSSFHYRDADIASGLSSSLYIPSLACLSGAAQPPVSMRRMLREYGRKTLAVVPDTGLLAESGGGLADDRITVVANPFGHAVTPFERSAVLGFFSRAFSTAAPASVDGPTHALASSPAQLVPYIERENRWRTELQKAMKAP